MLFIQFQSIETILIQESRKKPSERNSKNGIKLIAIRLHEKHRIFDLKKLFDILEKLGK